MRPSPAPALDEPLSFELSQLWIYPVKSCAGVPVSDVRLEAAGLAGDREWMVVDEAGEFLTQRDWPRMGLIRPRLDDHGLELRVEGLQALRVPVPTDRIERRVRVWDDVVPAFDAGEDAARWLAAVLAQAPVPGVHAPRLVRLSPGARRLASLRWTDGVEAPTRFSDGFPLLVVGQASLDELNRRLEAGHEPSVDMRRFRPNVVLDGLQAHDEDRIDLMRLGDGVDQVMLRAVKPCSRCSIPDLDPDTARASTVVGRALQRYRQDRRLDGAITFGMNAIVTQGAGVVLRVGMRGQGSWNIWGD